MRIDIRADCMQLQLMVDFHDYLGKGKKEVEFNILPKLGVCHVKFVEDLEENKLLSVCNKPTLSRSTL